MRPPFLRWVHREMGAYPRLRQPLQSIPELIPVNGQVPRRALQRKVHLAEDLSHTMMQLPFLLLLGAPVLLAVRD